MLRRPPRSTLDRSAAASEVYKRQAHRAVVGAEHVGVDGGVDHARPQVGRDEEVVEPPADVLLAREGYLRPPGIGPGPVSYTHLRAHETVLDIVCRLLLEKNKCS